jgi:hypothetical protein
MVHLDAGRQATGATAVAQKTERAIDHTIARNKLN